MKDACYVAMNKTVLNVGVVHDPPYADKCFFRDNSSEQLPLVSCFSGYAIELTQLICKIISAAGNFHLEAHGDWGARSDNGTWTGLLSQIQTGKYDLSLPAYSYTTQRMDSFQFASPAVRMSSYFTTRLGRISDGSFTKIFIFNPACLGLILAASCIVAGISLLTGLLQNPSGLSDGLSRLIHVICSTTTLFANQSVEKGFVTGQTGRVIIGAWAIGVFLLAGHFSAHLLAMLISQVRTTPFIDWSTLAKCVDAGKCRIVDTTLSKSTWSAILGDNPAHLSPGHQLIRKALKADSRNIRLIPQKYIIDYILNDTSKFNVWNAVDVELFSTATQKICDLEIVKDVESLAAFLFPQDKMYNSHQGN